MNCLSPYSIVVLQLLVIVSSSTKCSLEVPFEVKEQRVRFDNISPDKTIALQIPPKHHSLWFVLLLSQMIFARWLALFRCFDSVTIIELLRA